MDIIYEEDGKYFIKAHAFLPENSLAARRERIDYRQMEKLGYCTITKTRLLLSALMKLLTNACTGALYRNMAESDQD